MGKLVHGGKVYANVNHGSGGSVLSGTYIPSSTTGSNGQIYLRHLKFPNNIDLRESISNSISGAYFNTGYKYKENTRIETKFNVSSGADYPTPFGCRETTSGQNPNQNYFATLGQRVYYAFGNAEVSTDGVFSLNTDVTVYAEKSGLKMYVGNALKYLSTNAFSQAGTYELYLFGANLAGSPWTSSWAIMTLYYFKIYEDDVLVHYFIPALDGSDIPCLYDAITGRYLYNQGTGGLAVGNSLPADNEIIKSYAKIDGDWDDLIGTSVDALAEVSSNYTNTDYYTQSEQITDISSFTKLYSTESSVNYGSQGTRVNSALSITDESTLNSYMNEGWNSSHAAYYDSEDRIGAYAGYDFGSELPIKKVKLWLGRFSGQNKSLIATLQTLDGEGDWHDIQAIDISSSLPYPLNVFEIDVNRSCYGIRWIHKDGEYKNSGNNIVFFGMTVYKGVGDAERVFIPTEKVNYIPTGYSGFGTVVLDNDVLINELYSFDQSQGGVWINTNVDVSNLNYILFTFSSDPSAPDDRLMRQVLKSNIAVYTGGADVYTTIFTQAEIGLPLNVRIYNNLLWVSFNGTGSNTKVVTVYNPITF